MKPLKRPTDSELAILHVLWRRGASTVREVMEEIEAERAMGYTTVLKFMQIMHEKGLLKRDESMRTHVYEPAVAPEKTKRQLAGDLMDRVFDGSARDLIMGALGGKKVDAKEMDEIRKFFDGLDAEGGSQ